MSIPVVEFVSFSLKEGITQELYLEKYSRVYESFLKSHPDFISFRHLYDPITGIYANYVEWKTMEGTQGASMEILKNKDAQDWFSLMNLEGMKMYHLNVASDYRPNNINMACGLEFSVFLLNKTTSEQVLLESAREMCQGLYDGEESFLGHQILRGSNSMYVDVVWSTSGESARMLCAKWGQGPFAPECLNYLHSIDPNSAQLAFFDIIA